ncbi:MAG: hypothetical protein HY741_06430 [Chloroflexi bacterium]|nr:hypothetical protein [Chloroflexota bacterium]
MSDIYHFKGFIRDVKYKTHLDESLAIYDFQDFDINHAKGCGLVKFAAGQIGYSKWISPKRTRSYPFERLYNTYNSPMRLTVIPILEDEGLDGDLDRLQYSTVSWMNLLNVYIVLGYYANARKNMSMLQSHRNKLTGQKLDATLVHAQMAEISQYKQSALHWNRSLIEDRFVEIYHNALDQYAAVAERTGVRIHDRQLQALYLSKLMQDFASFKDISLRGSRGAALRETRTAHGLEYLADGSKATFEIENYLGGIYYLTADEIVQEEDKFFIQESKNATRGFLPSVADIKDGLFKLILFSNLDTLMLNDRHIEFGTRLKLTGMDVRGSIRFPCAGRPLQNFVDANLQHISKRQRVILERLNLEATNNRNLEIEIAGNR